MKLDMHVHSKFSDGKYNIEELISLYKSTELNGFALTDHDNVDGLLYLDEMNIDTPIKIIPGIEFSCTYLEVDVHILGLNIDFKNKKLLEFTRNLKKHRIKRAKKIIGLLKKDGIFLNETNIFSNTGVGRPHIAMELVDKGHAHNIQEAFNIFLLNDSKYYIPREYLSVKDAINLIHEIDGKAILAHPGKTEKLDKVLKHIEFLGIDGIEVIHPSNNKKMVEEMLAICKEKNYLMTGGSDFHQDLNTIGEYYIEY